MGVAVIECGTDERDEHCLCVECVPVSSHVECSSCAGTLTRGQTFRAEEGESRWGKEEAAGAKWAA